MRFHDIITKNPTDHGVYIWNKNRNGLKKAFNCVRGTLKSIVTNDTHQTLSASDLPFKLINQTGRAIVKDTANNTDMVFG